MKMKVKRLCGILLGLSLVLGLMPWMSLTAYAETQYNVWVGGTRVTSATMSGEGWSYTPASGETPATLTLNGYDNHDQVYAWKENDSISAAIYSKEALKIVLSGTNNVTNESTNTTAIEGIVVMSDLSITGTGTLNIKSKGSGIVAFTSNGEVYGSVMIEGCRLNVTASERDALYVYHGKLTIRDSEVTVNGKNVGIYCYHGYLNLENSTVTAASIEYDGIASRDITIKGGTVKASGKTSGIYTSNRMAIESAVVEATGTGDDSYGIQAAFDDEKYEVIIKSGNVTAKGSDKGIYGNVKNAIAGIGWTNVEGTEGQTDIAVNTGGQDLNFKKVQFQGTLDPATVTTKPTGKSLTYSGSAQELVTAGAAISGTIQYALGKDTTTAPTSGWSQSIPTGTEAKTYYVWYKAAGDESHSDSDAGCVTVSIAKKAISATVTFKVVNGSWNDGTNQDKTVKLSGYEGDSLKLAADQFPGAGSKPDSGYKAGNWDTEPGTTAAISKDVTYTYTYALSSANAATVTKAPTAKKLTYNGKNQKLVNAGTASNGKMYYALTKNTTAPKESDYNTAIPTAKNAGTYYVWYKAKGDTGYNDSDVNKVKVSIAKTEESTGFNTSIKTVQSDGKVVLSWTKVNNIKKVEVYVTYCGGKFSKKATATTTKNKVTIKKINGKKPDLTKNYMFYLVGYNSKGKKVGSTVTAYIAGKDSKKYTNVKSFSLNKASVSIKKGKSTTIKLSSVKLENSKKKQLPNSYAKQLRFISTNPKIAKVSGGGKVTGVKAGTCTVYAYTRNGLSKKINVKVTK